MNKQIKQLARQAGFATEEANVTTGNYQDGKKYFYAEDFIEDELKKFAELIVQECVGICDKRYADIGQDGDGWILARQIAEHFGVE